jgi:hypothetical protein
MDSTIRGICDQNSLARLREREGARRAAVGRVRVFGSTELITLTEYAFSETTTEISLYGRYRRRCVSILYCSNRQEAIGRAMLTPRFVSLLYAVLASLAILLLATTMPPMQNPDEEAHAYRADQVSRLVPMGQVLDDGEYGGTISNGLVEQQTETAGLRFHPELKATRAMTVALPWGVPVQRGFPNTAVNPPFFYVPAAAMDRISRSAGITLPHALVLMRLANGFATIVVAATAIALAGDASLWLFAVLLLPMSLAVSSAVTQDSLLLACGALAVSLYLRLRQPQSRTKALSFTAMCILFTMVAMARVPYYAFVLLLLATPVRLSWRVIGTLFMSACVIGWSIRSAAHFPLPHWPQGVVSPGLQVLGLATHPWRIPLIIVRTWQANDDMIARSFIGQLGWLDVDLPAFYRRIAWAGLVLAAILVWRRGAPRAASRHWRLEAVAVAGAVLGVGLIQYMTWTVVGSPVVDGIQGRYFLVPALVLGVLITRDATPSRPSADWLAVPVLLLPIISIAVTMHALILRYYF